MESPDSMEDHVNDICLYEWIIDSGEDFEAPLLIEESYFNHLHNDAARRFWTVIHYHEAIGEQLHRGDNLNSLEMIPIIAIDFDPCQASKIYWETRRSFVWNSLCHSDRPIPALLHGHEWSSMMIQDILLPWERWAGNLDYGLPSDGDQYRQARGIAFPKLNFRDGRHQIRLVLLLPSQGDHNSTLEAFLIVSTLFMHSCFIAIRHSRGHPTVRGAMRMDGKQIDITLNLELFLRNIRHPSECRLLYIRELCIDKSNEEETDLLLTSMYHSQIEDCSCGVLELNRTMELLNSHGCLPESNRVTEKKWFDIPSEPGEPAFSMPSRLQWMDEPLAPAGANVPQEELARWPIREHLPLDMAAREIRLLGMYGAANDTDTLIADIYHVPLRSKVLYHAISYTWGSEEVVAYLRTWSHAIPVTKNLYTTLLQFRAGIEPGQVFYLWIDAICIDQDNDGEKAQCIPMMHDIFDAAAIVMCSVAPSSMFTDAARSLLKQFTSEHDNDNLDEFMNDSMLDAWADVYVLLCQPYWSRRWIIQELFSASVPVILVGETRKCNDHTRALRTFSKVAARCRANIHLLFEKWSDIKHPILDQRKELRQASGSGPSFSLTVARGQIEQTFSRIRTLVALHHRRALGKHTSFLYLAIATQDAKCADARDIIYSLWNIAKERMTSMHTLSYLKSVAETYIDFTRAYALQTGSLDIMCISQVPTRGHRLPNLYNISWDADLGLPSWSPDYRQDGNVSSIIRRTYLSDRSFLLDEAMETDVALHHADMLDPTYTADSVPFRFDGEVLVAQGVIVDTVQYVSIWPSHMCPAAAFTRNNHRWRKEIHEQIGASEDFQRPGVQVYRSAGKFDESVDRGLNKPPASDHQELADGLLQAELSMLVGEKIGAVKGRWLVQTPEEKSMGKQSFWYRDDSRLQVFEDQDVDARASETIRGRILIVTENGFMGLAPWHVKVGFKLAILCGCSVPVLLEKLTQAQIERIERECRDSDSSAAFQNLKPGWYFRGDCFVQGWMEGQMMRPYGSTTQEAWDVLSGQQYEVRLR